MEVISLKDDTRLSGCYAATVGFFDGVHKGHRYVVEQLRRQADARRLLTMVITFDRHPRQVVHSDWQPLLLTTLDEKIQLLTTTGVDMLVVLHFDQQMASLTARDFMQQVLKDKLGVRLLLTGYDNRFGHREKDSFEGFDDYVCYGREMGIDVVCGEGLQTSVFRSQASGLRLQTSDFGPYISSSLIRRLIREGHVAEAAQCLGRPYCLGGVVVHGFQEGRKMGFPTANMLAEDGRLLPKDGVYVVNVIFHSSSSTFYGLTNIGMRPTFDGHQRTIETHILDFEGDIYGQSIGIEFVARLRDEKHFGSTEELAQQMACDAETARLMIATMK